MIKPKWVKYVNPFVGNLMKKGREDIPGGSWQNNEEIGEKWHSHHVLAIVTVD